MGWQRWAATALCALVGVNAAGLQVNVDDPASLTHAAFVTSHGMMQYYIGNESGQTPGYLPGEGQPNGYYWWEGGAMFGTLIDYWYYTGDDTYNAVVTQALLFQVGPDKNYQPDNASTSLGNDDQAFWAFSALKAAELKFPNPPSNQPQWLPLVQTVFAYQIARWDTASCNGGLRWQVFPLNTGYTYKNTISNGCLFNMAARLGKYTGNQTYFDWADKAYEWIVGVNLIDQQSFIAWDGTHIEDNCTSLNRIAWSYNFGALLHGSATMWNKTSDPKWKTRVDNLLQGGSIFFRNGTNIMWEYSCEDQGNCNNDMKTYKAFTSMWMAETAKYAPWTEPTITPLLRASAQGAAQQCSGGSDGVTCGIKWGQAYDGSSGVGQQMSAMEVFLANLAPTKPPPVEAGTGGISRVDPNANRIPGADEVPNPNTKTPIGTADRAGAGILSILFGGGTIGAAVYLSV